MSFVVLEVQSHTERKDKDSPTVRANRVLDLAEQEGLQTAYIPGACDGTVSKDFMIGAKMARMVIQLANCVKRGTTCWTVSIAVHLMPCTVDFGGPRVLRHRSRKKGGR